MWKKLSCEKSRAVPHRSTNFESRENWLENVDDTSNHQQLHQIEIVKPAPKQRQEKDLEHTRPQLPYVVNPSKSMIHPNISHTGFPPVSNWDAAHQNGPGEHWVTVQQTVGGWDKSTLHTTDLNYFRQMLGRSIISTVKTIIAPTWLHERLSRVWDSHCVKSGMDQRPIIAV